MSLQQRQLQKKCNELATLHVTMVTDQGFKPIVTQDGIVFMIYNCEQCKEQHKVPAEIKYIAMFLMRDPHNLSSIDASRLALVIYDAQLFATKKHKGQIRRNSGESYIEHPLRVSRIVGKYTKNTDLIICALLHDTIEDTTATYLELKENFGENVANIVLSLTNDKKEITRVGKTKYLLKKMNNLNNGALLVKLADRLDNVSDLSTGSSKWSYKYAKQTKHILDNLNKTNVTNSHLEIIVSIRLAIQDYVYTDKEDEYLLTNVSKYIEIAKKQNLLPEVICTAIQSRHEDPTLTPIEALQRACIEWEI